MTTLITGATGFIGSRLVQRCLDLGQRVRGIGLGRNTVETAIAERLTLAGADVRIVDINDRPKILEALHGVDLVYHLAAAQHEANAPDEWFKDVNVTGTRTILDASVESGVGRFVHASTIGVYGSSNNGAIREENPLLPDNIYGLTKLEGEKLALAHSDRLPVTVLRVSETYGPGDRRLVKLFKAIKNGTFLVIGAGTNLHHPIFIDDLIAAFWKAARSEKALGRAIVVAGERAITTNEMVKAIASLLNKPVPRFHAPMSLFRALALLFENTVAPLGIQPPIHQRRLDFFIKSFEFSNQDARSYLGFVPETPFEKGIAATAKWYSEEALI